jgi:hypothetical protein
MKHTPGPWRVDKFPVDVICKDGRIAMLEEDNIWQRDSEILANADLIARAPELEHLARDLVALLFWRWRKNEQAFAKSMESGENTRDFNYMLACQEVESYQNFKAARDYLYSKTKGD